MTKHPAVFIISLTLLVLIVGCLETDSPKTSIPQPPLQKDTPKEQPKIQQPPQQQPSQPEPKPEPEKTEPAPSTPKQTEPNIPEQITPEPEKTEPEKIETPQTKTTKTTLLSADSFNDRFTDFFDTYVNKDGLVDYYTLRRKQSVLKKLLDEFAKLNRKDYNAWSKNDKIAFWINAYNIQMIKIIIDNYPIQSTRYHRVFWPATSIRHIKPWNMIGVKKWDEYKFLVMDEEFVLSEIKKRFFIDEFAEPKIFFALSHASLSGPLMHNKPYYGGTLQQQLDQQIKKNLSSPLALQIDRQKQVVYLSAIFEDSWDGPHFVKNYATNKKFKAQTPITRAVLNFISKYIPAHDVSFLEVGNYNVKYIKYGWRLNETKRTNIQQ